MRKKSVLFSFKISESYMKDLIKRFGIGYESLPNGEIGKLSQGEGFWPQSELKTSLGDIYDNLLLVGLNVTSVKITKLVKQKGVSFKVAVVLSNTVSSQHRKVTDVEWELLSELFKDNLWYAIGYLNEDTNPLYGESRQLVSFSMVGRRPKAEHKERQRVVTLEGTGDPELVFSEFIKLYPGG